MPNLVGNLLLTDSNRNECEKIEKKVAPWFDEPERKKRALQIFSPLNSDSQVSG
jgi:hypothetical protein